MFAKYYFTFYFGVEDSHGKKQMVRQGCVISLSLDEAITELNRLWGEGRKEIRNIELVYTEKIRNNAYVLANPGMNGPGEVWDKIKWEKKNKCPVSDLRITAVVKV